MTDREKHKQKLLALIEQRGLCSVMNDTKWRELKQGVAKLPFPPPYVLKSIDEEESSYHEFEEDVGYIGSWGFQFPGYLGEDIFATPFYEIEWIKVRPRYKKHRGRLIPDSIVDETEAFRAVLEQYDIPYEEENGAFLIHGYQGAGGE